MVRAAFRAGMCLSQLRDFNQALQMFSHAEREPYTAIAAIEIANSLWELNQLEEAARQIEESVSFNPQQLQLLYLQLDEYVDIDRAALVAARIADAQGNAVGALHMAERVLTHNPREFEARALQIKNLRILNRTQEAEVAAQQQAEMIANRQRGRELRLELETNPNDIDKLYELAELYWRTESDAEAQLIINDILRLDPASARARELLAKIKAPQSER